MNRGKKEENKEVRNKRERRNGRKVITKIDEGNGNGRNKRKMKECQIVTRKGHRERGRREIGRENRETKVNNRRRNEAKE